MIDGDTCPIHVQLMYPYYSKCGCGTDDDIRNVEFHFIMYICARKPMSPAIFRSRTMENNSAKGC